MLASKIEKPKGPKVFIAVSFLVLAQVSWWTIIFLRDVNTIAILKRQNILLSVPPDQRENSSDLHTRLQEIERAAVHRRFMFLSEGITFAALTCVGLYLLFDAMRREARSREIQKNFIEIVTHESKTPLTALKLRLESVLEKRGSAEEVSRSISLALDEVRRLSSTFEKVLSWNRLERQVFQFDVYTAAQLIQEVISRLEPFLRSHHATVKIDCNPEAVIFGDAFGIQNTIQSLVENAVLYNDRPLKEVRINVRQGRESLSLEVADNGPGIPLEERQRIFERFYRGKSSRRASGTGLGLYIAQNVIRAHRGILQMKESGPNGSLFEVILPLEMKA